VTGLRVLIVDDEPLIREGLTAYFEDEGFAAVAVPSGEAALTAVRSGGFDVCIMDMRLPGMDGNATMRALDALAPRMRYIVHTGSASYVVPDDLRARGVSPERVFVKPLVDMAPLARAVRALAAEEGYARE
jgi:CheY-like chemotaxis protein